MARWSGLVGHDRFAGVTAAQVLARLHDVARWYLNPREDSDRRQGDPPVLSVRHTVRATACPPSSLRRDQGTLQQSQGDLDPVKLLKELLETHADLARLRKDPGDTTEVSEASANMDSLLTQLPELWRLGRCARYTGGGL